jgi:ABC-type branched-subunit amino acid transport system substrate-binding protein
MHVVRNQENHRPPGDNEGAPTMALRIAARVFLTSALIFCLRDASAQDIRIAVVGSMTGSLAEAGDQVRRGAELAV